MEIPAKPPPSHLCRVCIMATGFASRLWQWFAWGIMQVNRVKLLFFYCRDASEDRDTCSCLQTLWRLLQPVALGTAKALQCYCCFTEIMATDWAAQFATMWKKVLGLNKTRVWQLWDGATGVSKFPITPWLWMVSKSCCLQPSERLGEKASLSKIPSLKYVYPCSHLIRASPFLVPWSSPPVHVQMMLLEWVWGWYPITEWSDSHHWLHCV